MGEQPQRGGHTPLRGALLLICLMGAACSGGGGGGGGGGSGAAGPATPWPVGSEICDNGLDDDLDGLTDCEDPDCYQDPGCEAAAVHVAVDGIDSGACGGPDNPCGTIQFGVNQAASGQTVQVHSGTYTENWITMKNGVTVASADGQLAAKIDSDDSSAVRFESVSDAQMIGFEIFGNHNGGPPRDGLVRVLNANDVSIRDCMIHDAPNDADVVKVNTVDGLLLERLIVYNPARRTTAPFCTPAYQENIDLFGLEGGAPTLRNVIVRGCWLFHTNRGGDWLMYTKVNAENIVYENNVFGPSAGAGCGNPAVGIGNGQSGPGVQHAIVRNNVFVGLKGDAAFAVQNSSDVWVYNNTFCENSGADLRALIEFRGNVNNIGEVNVFNNMFVDNQPAMNGGQFYWNRDQLPSTFYHDYNLYMGNVVDSDVPFTGEPNSLYDSDPLLESPGVPSTASLGLERINEIAGSFRILTGSPAIDYGLDAVSRSGHPFWAPGDTDSRVDIFGTPRPQLSTWELGVHEQAP